MSLVEQYYVKIIQINDNDHVLTVHKAFPTIPDISRFLYHFKPSHGYSIEKITIEKDRIFDLFSKK